MKRQRTEPAPAGVADVFICLDCMPRIERIYQAQNVQRPHHFPEFGACGVCRAGSEPSRPYVIGYQCRVDMREVLNAERQYAEAERAGKQLNDELARVGRLTY